jgi:hypothetical protein
LDWTVRENNNGLFGPVLGKFRRVQLDELDNEYLRNGWLSDTEEHGAIDAYTESDTPKSKKTWIANQVHQPFRYLIASLVYKPLFPFRSGDLKKSMAKDAMFGASTSLGRRRSIFRPVWSMISVSPFY